MFLRVFTAILISIFFVSSHSEASQASKAYQDAKREYSNLKKSQKLQRSRDNWLKVINRYETFAGKYPKDGRTDDVLLLVGDLYARLYGVSKRGEDINAAIESYRTLVKRFPRSPSADDAVFKTGELYLNKGKKEAAYIEFDKVLRKYPKGDMAPKAATLVKKLSREVEVKEPEKPLSTVHSGQNGKNGKYAHVTGIKHWSNPDYTRVVIYADKKVPFKETFLKEREGDLPPRLFLDIAGSKLNRELMQPITINDGLLRKTRTGQFDLNTVRVVLDIESIDSYKIFALENPYRIVVDVSGEKRDKIEDVISQTSTAFATPTAPETGKIVQKPSLAQQLSLGIKRIVVDPGHGGHDAGAVGYKGLKEKDVVLDIGKVLRDVLVERLGVEVVMTRDTDVFIPLEERTAIANTVGADLFISVHANASRNKKAGGIETYFLNFATDEDSMRLAATENATTTKNISDLQAILNDLMLNSKINESSKLARYVQGSILDKVNGNGSRAKDRGVRQAPFYVLIGAQMPSILIETSFITNKEDARRLADQVFQKTIAKAIAGGIEKYSEVVKVASSQ